MLVFSIPFSSHRDLPGWSPTPLASQRRLISVGFVLFGGDSLHCRPFLSSVGDGVCVSNGS